MVETEREVWRLNRRARLLADSSLPSEKIIHSFDRRRPQHKVDAHLSMLVEGSFRDRSENGVGFGSPKSGKTHLLFTIGKVLIQQGRCVLFTSRNLLVEDLLVGKRDRRQHVS